MPYTTRIAPSPTGDMHLGTARTAYFNFLAARASAGHFILRIDDTDLDRNKQEHVDVILQTFEWLGLEYDELVYQSKRFDHYRTIAEGMAKEGLAKVEANGGIVANLEFFAPMSWVDEISGEIKATVLQQKDGSTSHPCSNLVLIKSDTTPTYNFCTIVDDLDLGVNYIIRGVDHISNTVKQLAIAKALGSSPDTFKFAHVGLIHKDKKKLSKRDGAASLLGYKDKGVPPDAILNFMLRLGWGPRQDDKSNSIIDKSKAVSMFLEGGSMKSSPANFDQAKFDWFVKKYGGAR